MPEILRQDHIEQLARLVGIYDHESYLRAVIRLDGLAMHCRWRESPVPGWYFERWRGMELITASLGPDLSKALMWVEQTYHLDDLVPSGLRGHLVPRTSRRLVMRELRRQQDLILDPDS